jgi:ABC transport system ATP-binding/permease protein
VAYSIGDRKLFDGLTFAITNGTRVGLVGPNGSGKTTLLRLVRGDIEPTRGTLKRADALRVVYFDQKRELDPDVSLRRALAPDSDSVIYQDRVIHVASWAARFLFAAEDLNRPVGRLSGGERARVLIAQLMLQPADVLLLDEPTNDLDIPTLEILEESLLEYRGALVLVTHDRFMLDRVSTVVLGLDGRGSVERFADYSQWEEWLVEREAEASEASRTAPTAAVVKKAEVIAIDSGAKKRAADSAAREAAKLEKKIADAEAVVAAKRAVVEDPAIATDAPKLHAAFEEMQKAQAAVDALYAKWAELEKK